MSTTTITGNEAAAEAGGRIDASLIRGFLERALGDEALADEVNLLIFDHVVAGQSDPSTIAARLPTYVEEILDGAAAEDWRAVADGLIAEARELEAPAEEEDKQAEPTPGNEAGDQAGPPPLRFIDHHRQRYADTAPIAEAGEFIVGSYREDGSLTGDGEFRVTLVELTGGGGRWETCPHLEAFGDGAGALRRATEAGLPAALAPVGSREEFARRLLAMGMVDGSDEPLPACPDDDDARQAGKR